MFCEKIAAACYRKKWQKCSEGKLLKFLPCFPYWKGLNVPPRDSQCLLEFSQLVGLSYCLTFSPHLFFFNSHRAPNSILFPLKMEALLGPCNILTHLESWEPALKKTIFFSWLIPLDFFLTNHLLLCLLTSRCYYFYKRTLKERHNAGLGWDKKLL